MITFPTSENSCVENYFFHLLILFCFILLKGSPSLLWIVSELTAGRTKAYSLISSSLIPAQNKYLHRIQLLTMKPTTCSGRGRKRTFTCDWKPWETGCYPFV